MSKKIAASCNENNNRININDARIEKDTLPYRLIDTDPTIQAIREKESSLLCGETQPIEYDSTYIELHNLIISDEELLEYQKHPASRVNKRLVKDSIKMWSEFGIDLHKIKILDRNYNPDGLHMITEEFANAITLQHPSELPIIFVKPETQAQGVAGVKIKINDEPETSLMLFRHIFLAPSNTQIASCVYSHEITHTQLYSIGSYMSDLLNDETIPILMEEIFGSRIEPSTETIKMLRYHRLIQLSKFFHYLNSAENIPFAVKVEVDTYIQSTLQAIRLANIFLTGTSDMQKEMLNNINNLFAGKKSVEDILTKYEANIESVPKDLKVLKHIKR